MGLCVTVINSYGPSSGPKYMGGPYLYNNDAACLFNRARQAPLSPAGGGYIGC